MSPVSIFINPRTGILRGGWRVLFFVFIMLLPYLLLRRLSGGSRPAEAAAPAIILDFSPEAILGLVIEVVWLLFVSWLCLKILERLDLRTLGVTFYRGWWRDVWLGCAIAAAMVIIMVMIQILGGGTRLMLSPMLWKSADGSRVIDWIGLLLLLGGVGGALLFFIFAAAFEELLCRGYPFQTLLRSASAIVPILLLSLIFGLLHLENPNATPFGITNTILAGVWLSIAYLKTRGLWFPTALHFTWNWVMGVFFGLPVSGIKTSAGSSVFLGTSESPVWLTGGSYGCEGGAAATVVLLIATAIIWRARWLKSPEPESEGLTNPESQIET